MKKVNLIISTFFVLLLIGGGCTAVSNKDQERKGDLQQKEFSNNQQMGWLDMSNNILLAHLNETTSTSSTEFTNSSGNGNDGSCPTNSECPTATSSGKINGAMDFDGSDDFINYGSDLEALNSYSITAWVNLDSGEVNDSDNGTILSRTTSTNKSREYYFRHRKNNTFCLQRAADSSFESVCSSETYTNTSTWYFVAATYDNNTGVGTIYVNGDMKNSSTIDVDVESDSSRETFIGKTVDGSKGSRWFFDGKVDETALFKNRVLSSEEVEKIYNNQKSASRSN